MNSVTFCIFKMPSKYEVRQLPGLNPTSGPPCSPGHIGHGNQCEAPRRAPEARPEPAEGFSEAVL